jgi:hypothetical protein
MSEPIDFDRVLPCYTPPRVNKPEPEPDGAQLLWRLRRWEFGCIPGKNGGIAVGRWLLTHDIKLEGVSYRHDITVWRHGNGQAEIAYMRTETRNRKGNYWTVAVPTLVPLKVKPPVIRRSLFLNFDKFQAMLEQGHQGRSPSIGESPQPPACPVCSREESRFVLWPCPPLVRWMPRQIRRRWREHLEKTLREREEVHRSVRRQTGLGRES